jgi:hypothetical protein
VRAIYFSNFTDKLLVLLCYKLDSALQDFRRLPAGMVVACLHERQDRNFRRPATTADELS